MEQIQLPKNGRAWWGKQGINIQPTEGEIKNNIPAGSDVEKMLAHQEVQDATRLIQAGTRTGDAETVRVGRAKLRMALGKDHPVV